MSNSSKQSSKMESQLLDSVQSLIFTFRCFTLAFFSFFYLPFGSEHCTPANGEGGSMVGSIT